jgi:hypothetical protein
MPQSSKGISVGDKVGCVELPSTLVVCSCALTDDDRLASSRLTATCCPLRTFAMAASVLSPLDDRKRGSVQQDGVELRFRKLLFESLSCRKSAAVCEVVELVGWYRAGFGCADSTYEELRSHLELFRKAIGEPTPGLLRTKAVQRVRRSLLSSNMKHCKNIFRL